MICLLIAVDDGGPASTRRSKGTYNIVMLQEPALRQLLRSPRSENVLAALRLCDRSIGDGLLNNFLSGSRTHLPLHRENGSAVPFRHEANF